LSHSDIYDVVVVGGGHAGCEAAAAAANLGSRVLLVTMNMGAIGQMSCNPAMGGIAKGQIVREIDALGGYSGVVSDRSMIQFRMLNRSKGPAMWSPRTQNDRARFAEEWRLTLERTPNVHFWQDSVVELVTESSSSGASSGETAHPRVVGVRTALGSTIRCRSVVLTSGTFMNGVMHIGDRKMGGGRAGEKASHGITEQLVRLGFESGRMKTGTPPRVDGRSIDYSVLEEQPGDSAPGKFSFLPSSVPPATQLSCWITYTNTAVHDVLRSGFDRSPMYNGAIAGTGPRYCPSIEDKITRFEDRDHHQIFVEPEGWQTVETYINGFSTSLPEDVQVKALRLIPGFGDVRIFRPGYAVEYDYFPPTQLKHSLETKLVDGLFFAGQINGTTGYEEAACQGLMAGINAHQLIGGKEPFVLGRDEAYIGVLIDDLITKGTEEPYRMFTSRAEFRLMLRQDNADLRLTPKGFQLGLADEHRMRRVESKRRWLGDLTTHMRSTSVSSEAANEILVPRGTTAVNQKVRLYDLLLRPQISFSDLVVFAHSDDPDISNPALPQLGNHAMHGMNVDPLLRQETIEQLEIGAKYGGYLEKEREAAERVVRLENLLIDPDLEYRKLGALSMEARQKLDVFRPTTLGQASRISGVSPSDISVLLVYLSR